MTAELTIRDQFAMAALTGLCADPTFTGGLPKTSYNIAEEMLAEKERRDVQALLAEREHQKKLRAIEEKVLQEHSGLIKAFDNLNAAAKKLERHQEPKQPSVEEICHELGAWLSAALDDPNVCQEYKDVIERWFAAGQPAYTTPEKLPLSKLPPDNLTA